MNRLSVARLVLAALFVSTAASAQGALDALDLTADEKPKTEDKKPDADKPPDKKPVAAKTDAKPEQKNDGLERDVTQEDRVKSRQRKLYIKRGRFELAPSFIINVNDAYYTKLGGAVRLAFYPADSLAIAARFSLMQTLPTDDVRAAKRSNRASSSRCPTGTRWPTSSGAPLRQGRVLQLHSALRRLPARGWWRGVHRDLGHCAANRTRGFDLGPRLSLRREGLPRGQRGAHQHDLRRHAQRRDAGVTQNLMMPCDRRRLALHSLQVDVPGGRVMKRSSCCWCCCGRAGRRLAFAQKVDRRRSRRRLGSRQGLERVRCAIAFARCLATCS